MDRVQGLSPVTYTMSQSADSVGLHVKTHCRAASSCGMLDSSGSSVHVAQGYTQRSVQGLGFNEVDVTKTFTGCADSWSQGSECHAVEGPYLRCRWDHTLQMELVTNVEVDYS